MTGHRMIFHDRPLGYAAAFGWLATSLVLGALGALVGLPLLYACISFAIVVIFATIVTSFPSAVMVASVWALALLPFSYGIETGVFPKLFADEALLLLYLLVFFPMHFFTDRVWLTGFTRYFWLLTAFVLCQCLSLLVRTDLIAFRDLIETFVLGPMLLVVFLQEASNTDRDELFASAVAWLTVTIAVLSLLERVAQRNPILEQLELASGFPYLSPRVIALTEGVYRPYVTFLHPSETGTFMALGLPYAIYGWMRQPSGRSAMLVLLVFAGLAVNGTRGVWVGVALSLLLLARKPVLIALTAVPALGLGGAFAFMALRDTPFMKRLTDSNDLLARFIYWDLGARVFADHMMLGVGHMQFQKVYLDYVHNLSELAKISIRQIYVLDNIYLTTLVDHGIVGFTALVGLFLATGVTLTRLRKNLLYVGLMREASLVQSTMMVLVVYMASGFFADVNQFTKVTKFFFILIGFGLGAGARSLRVVRLAKPDGVDVSRSEYAI